MLFFVAIGSFGLAMIVSEMALHGLKVQTGLSRAVFVYGAIGGGLLAYWVSNEGPPVPLVVFWGGAFLTWFGVRSHIESSILLRMVYMLRGRRLSEEEILRRYEAVYGIEMRRGELLRAGLAEQSPGGMKLTPKGRLIVNATSWLR